MRFLTLALVLTIGLTASQRAEADVHTSIFGINGCSWSHLGANTGNFDRDAGLRRLEALRAAGVRWDRCDFWWGRIEPRQGQFVWDDYDWVVRQYHEHGVQLMPILCYASAWSDHHAPVTDEERELFARYVFNMVSRYRDVVKVWEVWNEPNITEFWKPTPNGRDYALLLKAAYEAAKRADPDCIIVGASTAGIDFAFIDELLMNGGGRYLDVISVHPYQGDLGSLPPDAGGLGPNIRALRTMLAEHGVDIPIWITEMGHRTPGGEGHTWVSEQQQADFLIRSYVIAQAAGVERLFWFNLQDWSERWGIIDMDFNPKPSFTAYQTMTRHLEGKVPVGTLDLGDHVTAYVYAPPQGRARGDSAVLVVWASDDREHRVQLPGRTAERWTGRLPSIRNVVVNGSPLFVTGLDRLTIESIELLPEPPAVVQREHREVSPPALPTERAAWHVPEASRRVVAAVALHEPHDSPWPLRIPAQVAPAEMSGVELFTVVEDGAEESVSGQRDFDGDIVFIAPPSGEPVRTFYLYDHASSESPLTASEQKLANDLIEVVLSGRAFAESVRLKDRFVAGGYTTGHQQLGGLFTASYYDTDGGWPRTHADFEVLDHMHAAGPVLAQYRSRVAFGVNRAEWEFTFTIYRDLPRISHVGRWLSPGSGATKQVNLGVSFPAGTQVIGQYGSTALPAAGIEYGRSAVIRPADHPRVTAVLVSPEGRLNTPGWANRAIVGTGLFYDTVFPATVTAEYFWYAEPPGDDLTMVAREHYRAVVLRPALTVGDVETAK